MNKNITIGVLVAIVLVAGFLALKQPTVVTVPTTLSFDASTLGSQKAPVVNVEAARVNVPAPIVNVNVPKQSPVLGSASPVSPFNYTVDGGFTSEYRHMDFSNGVNGLGTSTPCAFLSPAATSTLVRFNFGLKVGTSTAQTFTLATSTTPYATTTALVRYSVGANAQAYAQYVASSTNMTASVSDKPFAPNTYLVLGTEGFANGRFLQTGVCNAVFNVIN